ISHPLVFIILQKTLKSSVKYSHKIKQTEQVKVDGSTKRESKNTTQQREAFILEQVQEVSGSEEIPGEELSA
ncbi:MAG: hypothetical protein K2P02_03575, partial [Lachnospiraceae bacterium]|nr:hypothetical protein [Lachnospiraceae bacterium]